MLNYQRVIPTWTLHDRGPGRPPALMAAFLAPPQAAALERHRAPWNEKGPVFSETRAGGVMEIWKWVDIQKVPNRISKEIGRKKTICINIIQYIHHKPPQFSSGSSFMSNSSKFSERLAWLARATPKFVKEVWQAGHPEWKKKPPTLWLCQNSYWKWQFYSGISHEKWWFSIVMLVYRRVCY